LGDTLNDNFVSQFITVSKDIREARMKAEQEKNREKLERKGFFF